MPKGTELITPNIGFCFKTTINPNNNKKKTQKIFINICSHKKVQRPTFQNTENAQGKSGQNCQIPYLLGKIRLDQDNSII